MVSITSEYGIYLYSEIVDMRKGIDGLIGIIREGMTVSPFKQKSIFMFYGRRRNMMKVLVREYNRFELTKIRLDEGRFLRPITEDGKSYGKICWSDFVLLTESLVRADTTIKYIG